MLTRAYLLARPGLAGVSRDLLRCCLIMIGIPAQPAPDLIDNNGSLPLQFIEERVHSSLLPDCGRESGLWRTCLIVFKHKFWVG